MEEGTRTDKIFIVQVLHHHIKYYMNNNLSHTELEISQFSVHD